MAITFAKNGEGQIKNSEKEGFSHLVAALLQGLLQ